MHYPLAYKALSSLRGWSQHACGVGRTYDRRHLPKPHFVRPGSPASLANAARLGGGLWKLNHRDARRAAIRIEPVI